MVFVRLLDIVDNDGGDSTSPLSIASLMSTIFEEFFFVVVVVVVL